MRVHTTTRKHWTIGARDQGGIHCPECGAGMIRPCIGLPSNMVHVERVAEAGHSTLVDELPIHRAKIPHGAFAELRRLQRGRS